MPRSDQIRRNLADLAGKVADAQKKIGEAQKRRAKKEAEASAREASASRTSSASMQRTYLRQAESARGEVAKESKKIADLSGTLASLTKNEGAQRTALLSAEKTESTAARKERERVEREEITRRKTEERRRQQQRLSDERRYVAERQAAAEQLQQTEERLSRQIDSVRPPRKEQLRILYVTASSHGDLRLDEEIRRVKAAVRASTHRDQVTISHLPAATAGDLLDEISSFRPHVVHFSGHADESAVIFDTGADAHNDGQRISSGLLKRALEAPDEPPLLVVLNACKSAAQLKELLGRVPVAIGMDDSIGDVDALTFATRFYRALAEGQSVSAALAIARIDMEMNGLLDHNLPTLEALDGIDPTVMHLIIATDQQQADGSQPTVD